MVLILLDIIIYINKSLQKRDIKRDIKDTTRQISPYITHGKQFTIRISARKSQNRITQEYKKVSCLAGRGPHKGRS